MVARGINCFEFDSVHGHTCDVEPFYPSIGTPNKVPIIDAAVAYTLPYTHKTYVVIARNALYVPSMDNYLVPPIILWEEVVNVRENPKRHFTYHKSRDNALTFLDSNLLIPLSLWGIFYFLQSKIPTLDEIKINRVCLQRLKILLRN